MAAYLWHLGADRAFFLLGLQRRLAAGTHFLLRFQHGLARQVAVEALDELFQHADRVQVLSQSEAPRGQAAVVVEQFQVADTGVVVVRQAQSRAERPAFSRRYRPVNGPANASR